MAKRTNDEWRKLLAEQQSSGQTKREWCAANDINLYTFQDRASRLKKLDREKEGCDSQRDTLPVSWLGIKHEGLLETENLPVHEVNSGRHMPDTSKRESSTKNPGVVDAVNKKKPIDIRITNKDWTITIKADFGVELLTDVLKAVSRVCC